MNVTVCLTMNYEQRTMNDEKNEPNLSCRSLWRSRNKANFGGKKMTVAETNRNTWKTKTKFCTIECKI